MRIEMAPGRAETGELYWRLPCGVAHSFRVEAGTRKRLVCSICGRTQEGMGRSFVCRRRSTSGGTWSGVSCAGKARRVCRGGLGAEGGEAFDGEDLLIEDEAELAGGLMGDGLRGWARFGWRGAARVRGRGFRFQGW